MNLEEVRSIETNTEALANDLSGVYKILEDGFVDRGHRAADGALLHSGPGDSREDAALSNNHNL